MAKSDAKSGAIAVPQNILKTVRSCTKICSADDRSGIAYEHEKPLE